nr:hypothetical protein [Streptomyces sp. ISID311]
MIDPLADPAAFGGDPADAFDVLVPALPGFGFPGPLTGFSDVNFWQVLRPLAHPDDRDPGI